MALIFFSQRFVLFLVVLTNEYIRTHLSCNTKRTDDIIALKGYDIATPHGSDLRLAMNTTVLDQSKQKWFYRRGQCKTSVKSNSKEIARLILADLTYRSLGVILLQLQQLSNF
jgi:hypothetical protein